LSTATPPATPTSSALPDGTTHRVLKNVLSETQLRSMIDGVGGAARYWRGAHFGAFWYEASRSQRR
jgi:hypothetical protein